jgi:hypothetical protein
MTKEWLDLFLIDWNLYWVSLNILFAFVFTFDRLIMIFVNKLILYDKYQNKFTFLNIIFTDWKRIQGNATLWKKKIFLCWPENLKGKLS